MTKITIIGESPKEKQGKKIEFIKVLTANYNIGEMHEKPHEFDFIELVCLDYSDGLDLMFAHNNPDYRGAGMLVIGHFNDGIV